MEKTITIRPATSNDYDQLVKLLQHEKLPVEDLHPQLPHFFVTEEDGVLMAALGLEIYKDGALLRSVIVRATKRGQGLASQLLNEVMAYAASKSITKLFLITATAENYFQHKGFVKINREDVPASVLLSKEFHGLCPASAVIMYRSL